MIIMSLPNSLNDRRYKRFVEFNSNVCVRLVGVSGVVSSSASDVNTDSYNSFVENSSGDVSVRVSVV